VNQQLFTGVAKLWMILVTKGSHHLLLPAKMKEETGKSIKNALYVLCRYAKSTTWAEAMLSSETITSIALAIIKLWLSESIS